jgi:hypothetical protein
VGGGGALIRARGEEEGRGDAGDGGTAGKAARLARGWLAAAPGGKLAGASPEKAFSSYGAPFTTRFGPGGRGEWCEAHQVLDDGDGAV